MSNSPSRPSAENTVSMEQQVRSLIAMRSEVVNALNGKYSPRLTWGPTPGEPALIERAACDNGDTLPDGEIAYLPTWGADGTYAEKDWHAAVATVQAIAKKYGFDKTNTRVDEPNNVEIDGRSPDGGEYVFGFGVGSAFTISTAATSGRSSPPEPSPKSSSRPSDDPRRWFNPRRRVPRAV